MRRILWLALLQCAALGALTAPAVVGVSLLVRRMVGAGAAPGTYAFLDAGAALTAMIAAPLWGRLADRTVSRWGRRRPWLLGGAVAGVVGSACMAWAPDVLTLAAAWMFTQAAYNAVFAAVNGLLAEGLAPEDRTRAAGLFSAATFLGTLPGLAAAAVLAEHTVLMLLSVPLVALAVIVPVGLRLEDPPRPGRAEAPAEETISASAAQAVAPSAADVVDSPAGGAARPSDVVRSAGAPTLRGAFLAVLGLRFVFSLQLAAGLALALYLFLARWPLGEAAAVRVTSLTTLTGALGVVAGSALMVPRRRGRTPLGPVLALALLLLAAAMAGRALAPTPLVFHIATGLAGLGIGLGMTATRSLAYALLPAADAGFGLGLVSAAGNLAAMAGPLAAAGLLTLATDWGAADPYAGMYLLLALPALAGLALLPLLRTESAAAVSRPAPAR